MMSNIAKSFNILATSLNVLHILMVITKIFSVLYVVKDISVKPFFPCISRKSFHYWRITLSEQIKNS